MERPVVGHADVKATIDQALDDLWLLLIEAGWGPGEAQVVMEARFSHFIASERILVPSNSRVGEPWTDREDQLLMKHSWMGAQDLGRRLGRTGEGIRKRRKRLGLDKAV